MRIKVKKGEKVVVELTRKRARTEDRKPSASQTEEPAKGIIRPRREQEYLARRRRPGGIVFYDLGQRKDANGDFKDLDFQFIPEVDVNPADNGLENMQSFDLTQRTALLNKLLEVPVADWADNYKKIPFKDAEHYAVDIYLGTDYSNPAGDPNNYYSVGPNDARYIIKGLTKIAGSKWTPKGLNIKPTENRLSVFSGAGFVSFAFSSVKVTTEANYGADAADFRFGGKTEIFLVPQIALEQFIQFWHSSESQAHQDYLNGIFGIMSREFWLDPDLRAEWIARFGNGTTPWGQSFFSGLNASLATKIINKFKTRAGSRNLRYDFGTNNGYVLAGSTFTANRNTDSTDYLEISKSTVDNFTNQLGQGLAYPVAGALCAVVKTRGKTYYFWANQTISDDFWTLNQGVNY